MARIEWESLRDFNPRFVSTTTLPEGSNFSPEADAGGNRRAAVRSRSDLNDLIPGVSEEIPICGSRFIRMADKPRRLTNFRSTEYFKIAEIPR